MTKFSRVTLEAVNWPKWETLPDGTERYEDSHEIRFMKDGLLHRENGPAYIHKHSKEQTWYMHGKLHRTDGPAHVIPQTGVIMWWVNGKNFTEEEFNEHFGED